MKKFRFLILLLCAFVALPVAAQTKLTAADWQTDLRFLQQTVHKEYPFLFKNITPEQFNAEVDQLYHAMPSMKDHERLAGLTRIVSSIKYGHTSLQWSPSPVTYHLTPINFYWFSDGIYVEGVRKDHSAILGAKLIKVEGMPVMQALEAIKPLVPAENEQYFKAHGLNLLTIPEALHAQRVSESLKTTITYTFEKDGKTFEQTVNATTAVGMPRQYGFVKGNADWLSVRDTLQTPHYLKKLNRIYYYEYLPASKTVYVRHSVIRDDSTEAIPAFYKKVFAFIDQNEVERLVLDVRLNGGGNNYKNKPIITGIIESQKINKPGKLFVIIGRRTFSACQNLVNELSNYTNALFVGEPTSENINFYGDNRQVELPKTKITVYLSFAWWQDKPQWENAPWLAPGLAVDMSFDDYRSNRDPVLEACINFSDQDVVINPMGHLRQLFDAGKLEQVVTDATKMASDPIYRYVGFEDQFNQSGHLLLNSGQAESALFVFQLTTKLYPASALAWNGLGTAYRKTNKPGKAQECFQKAITLDPKGPAAAQAKKMLDEMKEGKGN